MVKRIILKLFGRERIEFLRSKPFLAHGKYKKIIDELEGYAQTIRKDYGNNAELSTLLARKFAHIIDKGLHRKDVSQGHSKAIAIELEKNLKIIEENSLDSYNSSDESVLWAKEKLKLYKELQDFGSITELMEISKKSSVSFESYMELIKARRSNRQFIEKTVDQKIIEQIAETVNWASSSCNKQPIKLFATNNPIIAKKCLEQCKGGTGFSNYIPAFVAFAVDMRGYYLPDELYLPEIDASLGAQNFFVSASLFELSVTGLSWALKDDLEERNLRNVLQIPSHYKIIFNSVIGYAEKEYVQPKRKSIKNTIQIIN